MDYKYIEQLLERYWKCETSLEEEQILRTFFRQEEIPAPFESLVLALVPAPSLSSADGVNAFSHHLHHMEPVHCDCSFGKGFLHRIAVSMAHIACYVFYLLFMAVK